jgi:RNA polymerase sigma-B factor
MTAIAPDQPPVATDTAMAMADHAGARDPGEAGVPGDAGGGHVSDAELLAIARSAPPGSRERNAAREALVLRYQFLVRRCAQRFQGCPEPQEDLLQVGNVGLVKAINRFDPALGTGLRAYAEPCITGEIKRYFRDARWPVHVRRSARDGRLELRASHAELVQQLARHPSDAELARHIGVSDTELADARRADRAFQSSSLDAALPGGLTLADTLGSEDQDLELTLDLQALWKHLLELPEREQRLLALRFYGDLTQAQIGTRLGISQMQVSRLLTQVLSQLREHLLGSAGQHAQP